LKNRKLNIILIVAIVALYSAIVVKVKSISGRDDSAVVSTLNISNVNGKDYSRDTLLLLLDYPDPFIKTLKVISTAPVVSERSIPSARKAIQKSQVINWPKIIYNGRIQSSDQHTSVGILLIDGKKYLMRNQEIIQSIKVEGIYNDSISISFMNETKSIIKQ
jgi:hypothetical protein